MRRIERSERRRYRSQSPAERRVEARGDRREALAFARETAGEPSRVGKWTQKPVEIPNHAIHAVLMPTGKVLFWGYPPHAAPNEGEASIWDPSLGDGPGAYTRVDPPLIDPDGSGPQGPVPAPIYCSGQSLLPSGRILVTGGNRTWPNGQDLTSYTGLDTTFEFDPWTETWVRGPDMEAGRWYPSQVAMADGRTAILGGYDDVAPGGARNPVLETYEKDPGAQGAAGASIAQHTAADRLVEPYPNLFSLPDGNVLLAGADIGDSGVLHTDAPGGELRWSDLDRNTFHRIGGTAVMEPSGPRGSWEALQIGGYTTPYEGFRPASRTAESIDASAPLPEWKAQQRLRVGRSYHNTVLLPDGEMVTVGGAAGFSDENGNYETRDKLVRRRIELRDPRTGRWRLGPAQLEDRTYHSTALLLPDGRVWSAGDDVHGPEVVNGESEVDTAEIYSPPYLFKGARPRIGKLPAQLGWGDAFNIRERGGPRVARAALVAPEATTHANDNGQRMIRLRVRRGGPRSVRSRIPARPGVAPPGWYMLFAMSRAGVPAMARWVQVGP